VSESGLMWTIKEVPRRPILCICLGDMVKVMLSIKEIKNTTSSFSTFFYPLIGHLHEKILFCEDVSKS